MKKSYDSPFKFISTRYITSLVGFWIAEFLGSRTSVRRNDEK